MGRAQAGREHFHPQNTSLESGAGQSDGVWAWGAGVGLGLDPAVPSRAFSRLSFPRPSGDGHIAAVLFVLGWVGVVVVFYQSPGFGLEGGGMLRAW